MTGTLELVLELALQLGAVSSIGTGTETGAGTGNYTGTGTTAVNGSRTCRMLSQCVLLSMEGKVCSWHCVKESGTTNNDLNLPNKLNLILSDDNISSGTVLAWIWDGCQSGR